MTDLLLQHVRLPGSAAIVDLLLRQGRIEAIGPDLAAPPGAAVENGEGALVLPGLVDAHCHMDKTLWGLPWRPHDAGPGLMDKIGHERRVLAQLQLSPQTQSARLLQHMVSRGTTHARTHVDIGPDIGLSAFHGVMAMREEHRDLIDLQVVAFPQTGVMIRPGTLALLEQAVKEGAELVGGLDPIGIDQDPRGQLDGLFDIAGRHGCGLDIHVHDRGEVGAITVEMIAARSRVLGLKGRVAISHAFCLGSVEPARLDGLVRLLLDEDIAIMTHGPGGMTPFPPVRQLHEAGVRLFCGSDGVRDTWGPLNNGDMLERAFIVAYRNGFRDDPGLELALHLATHGGAQVMGAAGYGTAVGCAADLVLVDAENVPEAVVMHPPRRLVIKRGRVVARDGRCAVSAAPA